MSNIRIELSEEMFSILSDYCFRQGTKVAPYVRELIRRELEAQTGLQLNDNIGLPGQHRPIPRRTNAQLIQSGGWATAKPSQPRWQTHPQAPIPTITHQRLDQLIDQLLDNPIQPGLPASTVNSIIASLSGMASSTQVRARLQKRGKAVPATDDEAIQ